MDREIVNFLETNCQDLKACFCCAFCNGNFVVEWQALGDDSIFLNNPAERTKPGPQDSQFNQGCKQIIRCNARITKTYTVKDGYQGRFPQEVAPD